MKTIYRKVRLADGRIKHAKIIGKVGGDVWDINVKHRGHYVSPRKLKGRKYPIKTLTKTPFIDIDIYKKRKKKRK